MKKVSIIIPMYNSEKYINQCINSVINQTYKNLEIIVIDDLSTDNSIKNVNAIKDKRIKLIKNRKNIRVSKSRNKGVRVASGDYICFLDSDDYWVLDKIEKQVRFIENNNYTFIYSSYVITNSKKETKVIVPSKLEYKNAIKNTTIFTSTVMFDMKKLKKEDLLMEDIKIGQDTLCWWNILKKGITAYGIKDVLSYY